MIFHSDCSCWALPRPNIVETCRTRIARDFLAAVSKENIGRPHRLKTSFEDGIMIHCIIFCTCFFLQLQTTRRGHITRKNANVRWLRFGNDRAVACKWTQTINHHFDPLQELKLKLPCHECGWGRLFLPLHASAVVGKPLVQESSLTFAHCVAVL